MEFGHVGTQQYALLITGALIFLIVPAVIAIVWKIWKKERFTTILAGAAAFLLFAIILEKPIQNLLILPDHAASRFINARPVLWAFVVALFPGVFEETGRLVTFSTVLKKCRNRETSISYGLGHGLFEVALILGITYITYIAFSAMINSGTFGTIYDQVMAQAPDQVDQVGAVASMITSFSLGDLLIGVAERISAVAFHVGASVLVFYAWRDKKWMLYVLAIALHTAMDFVMALSMQEVISLSPWALEAVCAVFGIATFLFAYCFLYRKDETARQ